MASFLVPIIIGDIEIITNASNDLYGIDRVEFYINDELKANITDSPYNWTWDSIAFFKHTIKVVAFDNAGNSKSDELIVSKFF